VLRVIIQDEYKNKLFNACEKVINEDIPAINRIDYTHLSIFKRLIAKLIYSKVPFKVNVSSLAREFGVSNPTILTYLDILNRSKLINVFRDTHTEPNFWPHMQA